MIESIAKLFGRKPRVQLLQDPDFGELEYVAVIGAWHGALELEGQSNAVELLIMARAEPSDEQRRWLRDFMRLWRSYASQLLPSGAGQASDRWELSYIELLGERPSQHGVQVGFQQGEERVAVVLKGELGAHTVTPVTEPDAEADD